VIPSASDEKVRFDPRYAIRGVCSVHIRCDEVCGAAAAAAFNAAVSTRCSPHEPWDGTVANPDCIAKRWPDEPDHRDGFAELVESGWLVPAGRGVYRVDFAMLWTPRGEAGTMRAAEEMLARLGIGPGEPTTLHGLLRMLANKADVAPPKQSGKRRKGEPDAGQLDLFEYADQSERVAP